MDAKLARLVDDLQMNLPGVVPSAIQMALRNTLREFFIETNGWQQDITFPTTPDELIYSLVTLGSAAAVRLITVANQDGLPVQATMPRSWLVVIASAPSSAETWAARIAVTISGDMDTDGYPVFPTDILDRNYDVLLGGTLARLMSQVAKPYSNPQLASYYQRQFKGGLAQARHAINMQNMYGGQRWRFPSFARGSGGGASTPTPFNGDTSVGANFDTTASTTGALITALPITKGQLMAAISTTLSGGVFAFENWVSAAPDNSFSVALRYSEDAASLVPALFAYLQASASATPPGLGLTSTQANSQLSALYLTAQTLPR